MTKKVLEEIDWKTTSVSDFLALCFQTRLLQSLLCAMIEGRTAVGGGVLAFWKKKSWFCLRVMNPETPHWNYRGNDFSSTLIPGRESHMLAAILTSYNRMP